MAALSVWKFPTPTGAQEALTKLESLQKQQQSRSRMRRLYLAEGKDKPVTKQAVNMAGMGRYGAFTGNAVRVIFFVPFWPGSWGCHGRSER
jgi:uncharacterized membrane protein